MPVAAQIFAGVAAALHVLFFYLESIVFTKNGTYKSFGVATQADAEIVKPMALNQGFYNLFLAAGIVAGIVIEQVSADPTTWTAYAPLSDDAWSGSVDFVTLAWAEPLVAFSCACMVGAALVLLISSKGRLLRGVLIQGLAPLIALVLLAVA